MRVIVTGATGFLGGSLCRLLAEGGHQVVALGRNIEKGAQLARQCVNFVRFDLSQPPEADLLNAIGSADAFVHAGGLSSPWGPREDFFRANVMGTANALAMARSLNVRRFVFTSTPSLYFRFADQTGVREDQPLGPPINAYAESKQAAEKLVLASPDLSPIILRPRALYGPGDTTLLPRLMRAAAQRPLPLLRGGRAITDLTYVDDVARACIAAVEAPPTLSKRVFNIAGQSLPVRQVIEQAAERAKVNVRWRKTPWPVARVAAHLAEAVARLRPGAPEPVVTAYSLGVLAFTLTLDVSAARNMLGFSPSVSFEEGLALAISTGSAV